MDRLRLDDVPHPTLSPATDRDLDVMRAQLGRPMRGVVGIAARCVCGNPTVVATEPRLPDGTPFPTLYYLTDQRLTAEASRLEVAGVMRTMQARLGEDADLAADIAAVGVAEVAEGADGMGAVAVVDDLVEG